MVVRVDVRVWPVQAEQLYSCNRNLLDLVLEALQFVALWHDLHSGGGGALQGLGSLGVKYIVLYRRIVLCATPM